MGGFLALAALAPGGAYLLPLWLSGFAFGVAISNVWVITQRLAGSEAAGRWTGLQNFTGNLAGVVAPTITGILLDRTGHFLWPFLIVSMIMLVCVLSWLLIVGPVEPVDWNRRTSTGILQTSA
jgi:MFS family permease